MRPELVRLLANLIAIHRDVELAVNERVNRFVPVHSTYFTTMQQFEEVVTQFYWEVYFPASATGSIGFREHYATNVEHAFNMLRTGESWIARRNLRPGDILEEGEYHRQLFQQVQKGYDDGIRGLFRKLTVAIKNNLRSAKSKTLIEQTYGSTREQWTTDAFAYVEHHRHLLPSTKGRVELVDKFEELLLSHSTLMEGY